MSLMHNADKSHPNTCPDDGTGFGWNPSGRIAVPVQIEGRLLGLVFLDADASTPPNLASRQTQDALVKHMQAAVAAVETMARPTPPEPGAAQQEAGDNTVLRFRRIGGNSSVFLNGDYLIKGVAGAILWQILTDHVAHGRTEFTTRELRLEPALQRPGINENFAPRLVLLVQRLTQYGPDVRLERTGRGLIRLVVRKPVILIEG